MISRPRLERQIDGALERAVTLITGPAGVGKTTLIERWLGDRSITAAWCRLTPRHRDRCAFESALPTPAQLAEIDILILDDVHALSGSPSEADLEALIAERTIPIVLVGRRRPSFDLTRLRLSHQLVHLDGEDLRFRSWEIETLFADGFDRPLVPEERSILERKTNGWAAALQLFHLACVGRTDAQRVDLLHLPGFGASTLREYLINDVLTELDAVHRSFVTRTAVLPVLTASLCNELLGVEQSESVLRELEAQNLFVRRLPDGQTLVYHDVFRTQLCLLILEEHGERALADSFVEAGHLLSGRGFTAEALECFARAGAASECTSLLASAGATLAERGANGASSAWLEHLPPDLAEEDPWVRLALARAAVDRGDLADARTQYVAATERFPASAAEEICREEHRLVGVWEGLSRPDPAHWLGALRMVLDQGSVPAGVKLEAGPHGMFVEAISAGLSGRLDETRIRFYTLMRDEEASPRLQALAELCEIAFGSLASAPQPDRLVALGDRMHDVELQWGKRLAMAAQALTGQPDTIRSAQLMITAERVAGRSWVADLGELLVGLGRLRAGDRGSFGLDVVAARLRGNGARALGCYALAIETVARVRAGDPTVPVLAGRAELEARLLGLRPAEALCLRVLSIVGERHEADVVPIVERIEKETGIDTRALCLSMAPPPVPTVEAAAPTTDAAPSTGRRVTCQGHLEIQLDPADAPLPVADLKPRVRQLLCRLAMGVGRTVTDEQLMDDMWPESTESAAKRSLQVAVSSLRQLVDVEREPNGYRLEIADNVDWDLRWLTDVGRPAVLSGDASIPVLRRVVDLTLQPCFQDEPLTDWIADARADQMRLGARAARDAQRKLIAEGSPEAAIRMLRRGIEIDRYDDGLWRDLIALLDSLELHGGAMKARSAYDAVLRDLTATG